MKSHCCVILARLQGNLKLITLGSKMVKHLKCWSDQGLAPRSTALHDQYIATDLADCIILIPCGVAKQFNKIIFSSLTPCSSKTLMAVMTVAPESTEDKSLLNIHKSGTTAKCYYLAFAKSGPSLKRRYILYLGRLRWWLVGSLPVTFLRHLEKAYTIEVLPTVMAEEGRMFTCVLSLPQWHFYHNFELLILHTNVHTGCGRSWRTFLERVGWDDSHPYAHTEAKYTGIMPLLSYTGILMLPKGSLAFTHSGEDTSGELVLILYLEGTWHNRPWCKTNHRNVHKDIQILVGWL